MTSPAVEVPYVGAQREHYEECVRLIPALVKARLENRVHDVVRLYRQVVDGGAERGLSAEETWAPFAAAAVAWIAQLAKGAAELTGQEPADVLQRASYAAALWTLDGH